MKITLALAIISTVQSAAIKTIVSTFDDSTIDNIPENLKMNLNRKLLPNQKIASQKRSLIG